MLIQSQFLALATNKKLNISVKDGIAFYSVENGQEPPEALPLEMLTRTCGARKAARGSLSAPVGRSRPRPGCLRGPRLPLGRLRAVVAPAELPQEQRTRNSCLGRHDQGVMAV